MQKKLEKEKLLDLMDKNLDIRLNKDKDKDKDKSINNTLDEILTTLKVIQYRVIELQYKFKTKNKK